MKTMSLARENPSNVSREMYAWNKTLILAEGSSIDSLTGIGTLSSNFFNSSLSSGLTATFLNSPDSENTYRVNIKKPRRKDNKINKYLQ